MARMYPEDIECFEKATLGEKRVFRFLKEASRPHKDFICWYEPSIGSRGRTPDFVLFGRRIGLLVIEVKDWSIHQIITATPHNFTVRVRGGEEKRNNPGKQAKAYVNALMDRLKQIPDFLSDLPPHEGKLKIPIGRMVAFPNIKREEYQERGIHWIIPAEMAIFDDDLEPAGEILCDSTGSKFHDRISGSFPFRFKGLAKKKIVKLRLALWPESRIELPQRMGQGKSRFLREVQFLDEAQARLAMRLKKGHQIIKGPPGSGKTLILVHRCCYLYRYDPGVKRILLVCFNIALVSYLKRLIQDKGIGIGETGIHVLHFFQLCSRILEEPVHFENEDAEYYELVIQESMARASGGKSPFGAFDAILIDEGQDFSNMMLKTLLGLLRKGGDLVICLDSYQDLYRRRASWKSLGIKASGRTHQLKRVYRNTVEINDFTQSFLGRPPRPEQQLALLPDDFAFHGDLPELIPFRNFEEVEEFLIRDLSHSVKNKGYKRSEIAIIYDDKIYSPDLFAYDNRALPMRILKKLEVSGIPATWVSQDVRAKEMFDVTTDRVSLISIHSSKGLDFDLVYLMGMDYIRPTNRTEKNLISLVYVAMTRAKYRLVIPYVEKSEFIRRMI